MSKSPPESDRPDNSQQVLSELRALRQEVERVNDLDDRIHKLLRQTYRVSIGAIIVASILIALIEALRQT